MTKVMKEVKKAYKRDLIKQGIDKEIAEVMASVFTDPTYGMVKPVVDENN